MAHRAIQRWQELYTRGNLRSVTAQQRNFAFLLPRLAEDMRELDRQTQELNMLWYCTWRPPQHQGFLYRAGRSRQQIEAKVQRMIGEGRPVLADMLWSAPVNMDDRIRTYAGPGEGEHQYGNATDGVPMRSADPLKLDVDDWSDVEGFEVYGARAKELGLTWGGDWKSRDLPHVQRGAAWRARIDELEDLLSRR